MCDNVRWNERRLGNEKVTCLTHFGPSRGKDEINPSVITAKQ